VEAKVIWQGRLNFEGTADSGYTLPVSAKKSVGGDGQGFTPIELIATGLAGCTALDVISILQKKRQEVTAFEVKVNAQRASVHPKVITEAVIEYFITGRGVDEAAVLRSIELSATRYCPAQAMFRTVFPITLRYHIFEAGENGEGQPIKSGDYTPLTEG
jgi:putative redox protein